jgi:hypothetical protein
MFWKFGRKWVNLKIEIFVGLTKLTLPALQCTAATFFESFEIHSWTSVQNGLMSSILGGLWSSNGYVATLYLNFSGSYDLSEHLKQY